MANPESNTSNANYFLEGGQAISCRQFISKAGSMPILSLLTRPELESLYELVKLYDIPAETPVIKQGRIEYSVFILLSGTAAAVFTEKQNNKIYLAKFKSGDIFGERAFFADGIRNASIYTTTRSKLLEMKTYVLKDLTDKHPQIYDILFAKFEEQEQDFNAKVKKYLKQLRQGPRSILEGKAKFQLAGLKARNKDPQFGILKNLAMDGCKIEMDGKQFMNFQSDILGREIPVIIKLPENSDSISAVGKVAWYEQAYGEDVFGYRFNLGLEFVKLLKDSRVVLARNLEQPDIFMKKRVAKIK